MPRVPPQPPRASSKVRLQPIQSTGGSVPEPPVVSIQPKPCPTRQCPESLSCISIKESIRRDPIMNPSATARMLSQLWFITIAVLAIAVLYLAKVLLLPLGFAILFAFLLAPVVAIDRK